MDLPDEINAHVRALPANLQRETLDFIAWLEQRYDIQPPAGGRLPAEVFIERFCGQRRR